MCVFDAASGALLAWQQVPAKVQGLCFAANGASLLAMGRGMYKVCVQGHGGCEMGRLKVVRGSAGAT